MRRFAIGGCVGPAAASLLAWACTFGGVPGGVVADETTFGTAAVTDGSAPGTSRGDDDTSSGDGPDTSAVDGTSDGETTTNTTAADSSEGSEDTGPGGELAGQSRLVVQYFLDDIVPDDARGAVIDSASAPYMHLQLDFSTSDNQPNLVGTKGRRGLEWPVAHARGLASALVGGRSKIRSLHQSTAVTFELVLEVTSVHTSVEPWGRIFAWQQDTRSYGMDFGVLTAPYQGGFAIDVRTHLQNDGGEPMARLPLDASEGRVVLHVVYDSLADRAERVRLYLDGMRREPLFLEFPDQGETLVASEESFLVLGNRPNNDASFGGTIYYAAIYAAALTEEIVEHNAMVLAAHDDR